MTGVTCMTTANGKNARSSGRYMWKASASSTPPMIATASASQVVVNVTSSESNNVGQS